MGASKENGHHQDHYYNKENFPHFVHQNGNWDIYSNDKGYCASIPTAEAAAIGCKASHFGDAAYVMRALGITVPKVSNQRGAPIEPMDDEDTGPNPR